MASIWQRLTGQKEPQERKVSATGVAVSNTLNGVKIWPKRNLATFAKEGFIDNVIAYRCIYEIASSVGGVPFKVTMNGQDASETDMARLLRRPNPGEGGSAFFFKLAAFQHIAGNSYLEAVKPVDRSTAPPTELWALRPDRVKIVGGQYGLPSKYEYEAHGRHVDFPVDPVTGYCPLLHLKMFHPLDDWYGLSPMEPGAFSIDQHNAAGKHNASLLRNGARPGGALLMKGEGITEDTVEEAYNVLMDRFQGGHNSGKPFVLTGDTEWLDLSISPKDMDWNEGLLTQARHICAAWNVPHVLIVPGESTFNNRRDARLELWEQTIIPYMDMLTDELNNWLVPQFDDRLKIGIDLDAIPALEPRRESTYNRTIGAFKEGIITRNEARASIGFEELQGDDGDAFNETGQTKAPEVTEKAAPKLETREFMLQDAIFISNEIDDPQLVAEATQAVAALESALIAEYGMGVVQEISDTLAFVNNAAVADFVEHESGLLITRINETTRKLIADTIGEGILARESVTSLVDRVADVFEDSRGYRSRLIAQTESTKIAGFSAQEAFDQAGIKKKMWLTSRDNVVRDSHTTMDNDLADVKGLFTSGNGNTARYPGGFSSVSENANCRCALTASLDGRAITKSEADETWERREESRESIAQQFEALIVEIFTSQQAAVIERMEQIGGKATSIPKKVANQVLDDTDALMRKHLGVSLESAKYVTGAK